MLFRKVHVFKLGLVARILDFPDTRRLGFQRVKSTYSLGEISRQFGIPEKYIRRWSEDGLIPHTPGESKEDLTFDIRALARFRRIRDLKAKGTGLRLIDAELRGQLSLFGATPGKLFQLNNLTPFEEGLMLFEKGDTKAKEKFKKAIEEEDHVADAHCNLGIIEFDSGSEAAALDAFTSALAVEPRHFESHFNLGNLYFESGDQKPARLHYEMCARIEPEFPDTFFNLGLLLGQMEQLPAARDCLLKYSTLAAADPTASDQSKAAQELAEQIRIVINARI